MKPISETPKAKASFSLERPEQDKEIENTPRPWQMMTSIRDSRIRADFSDKKNEDFW